MQPLLFNEGLLMLLLDSSKQKGEASHAVCVKVVNQNKTKQAPLQSNSGKDSLIFESHSQVFKYRSVSLLTSTTCF